MAKKKSNTPRAPKVSAGNCPNCDVATEKKENDRRSWSECPRCHYVLSDSIVEK